MAVKPGLLALLLFSDQAFAACQPPIPQPPHELALATLGMSDAASFACGKEGIRLTYFTWTGEKIVITAQAGQVQLVTASGRKRQTPVSKRELRAWLKLAQAEGFERVDSGFWALPQNETAARNQELLFVETAFGDGGHLAWFEGPASVKFAFVQALLDSTEQPLPEMARFLAPAKAEPEPLAEPGEQLAVVEAQVEPQTTAPSEPATRSGTPGAVAVPVPLPTPEVESRRPAAKRLPKNRPQVSEVETAKPQPRSLVIDVSPDRGPVNLLESMEGEWLIQRDTQRGKRRLTSLYANYAYALGEAWENLGGRIASGFMTFDAYNNLYTYTLVENEPGQAASYAGQPVGENQIAFDRLTASGTGPARLLVTVVNRDLYTFEAQVESNEGWRTVWTAEYHRLR